MATVKTVENDGDVEAFIAGVEHEVRRRDASTLLDLMAEVTGEPARMWGGSIVGFGRYHYVYASGREGDMAAVGFSPRKAAMSVYLHGLDDQRELLDRLGPYSRGKVCLYIKDLAAVDHAVLRELVRRAYDQITTQTWPPAQD